MILRLFLFFPDLSLVILIKSILIKKRVYFNEAKNFVGTKKIYWTKTEGRVKLFVLCPSTNSKLDVLASTFMN